MRYCELTESKIFDDQIQIPEYFFRGSKQAMRSAYLTKIWRQPSADIPEFASSLLASKKVSHLYGLSSNLPFKINRTYQGMSNWGFGAYFATTIEWALRYGTNITVVKIDSQNILAIRAEDFAQRVEGTSGGELRRRLDVITGGTGMRDEAAVMSKVVRSMKKNAKALYVETETGTGQICVFGKSAIYPKFYFEIQS